MGLPKAVIDTNILVAAIRSRRGASFPLLSRLAERDPGYQPVVSVPLVLEYQDAMARAADANELSNQDIEDILDFFVSVSLRQKIFYLWRPLLKDAEDDHVLEVAVAARADYIVTFNIRDFKGVDTFGVKSITPQHFLQIIGE